MTERAENCKTHELFDCRVPYLIDLFSASEYPWDMLPKIKGLCEELVSRGIDGFETLSPGVLVGKNVKIAQNAVIEAPAVIGDDCEIRPGAYIRGCVIIGRKCVIGNSCELKNAVVLDGAQIPHYNYVGDSVLGNGAHMGAGSICSNLRSDKKNVVIKSEPPVATGLRKVGAILADGADVGCGCVLNPGTVIGRRTTVYPLTSVRGTVPADHIVKSNDNIVLREENR